MELQERWIRGLAIRRSAPVSVGRQLEAHLSRAIHEGRFPFGCPLPSTRRVAGRVAIHRNTVAAVYRRLAAQSLVTIRPGRVARVVSAPRPPDRIETRAGIRRADILPLEPAVRRVAVVAEQQRHRAAVTAELSHRLGRGVEVIPVAPERALGGPGRLAGLLPVVELPFLATLRSLSSPLYRFVHLRYAPLAPVLVPERTAGKKPPLVVVLTSSPRLREDVRSLAAGTGDVRFLFPGEETPPRVVEIAVTEADRVWTDWSRREETGWSPGTGPANVSILPLVAGATVRELHLLTSPASRE